MAVTVVQPFDEALRQTPYDAFVERIRVRVPLSGFLMTPDAAFGFERRGTPATLADLGARDGFEVVVVPPFTLDGEEVRSSAIREAIVGGDLATAARLLGRPVTITGSIGGAVDGRARLDFSLPVALPPGRGLCASASTGRRWRSGSWPATRTSSARSRTAGSRSPSRSRRRRQPPRISGAASGFAFGPSPALTLSLGCQAGSPVL